jgi:hypothetical protein
VWLDASEVTPDPSTPIVLPVGRVGSLTLIGPITLTGVVVPFADIVSFCFLASFFLRMGLATAADGLGCPVTVIAGYGVVIEFLSARTSVDLSLTTTFSSFF